MKFARELLKLGAVVLLFLILQQGITGVLNHVEKYAHFWRYIDDNKDSAGTRSIIGAIGGFFGTFYLCSKLIQAEMSDKEKREADARARGEDSNDGM